VNKVIIAIIIAVIIAVIITIGFVIANSNQNEVKEEWNVSGPFKIDKKQYNLGEKIFMNVEGIKTGDVGSAVMLRPINDTHHEQYLEIKFNGTNKKEFNYYFEPKLNAFFGTCSVNDLIGSWKIELKGTKYPNINFKIVNKISDWDSRTFEPVC